MTDPSDLPAERRALAEMPGALAVAKIDTVGRINKILHRNIADLAAHVDQMQDPAVALPILDLRQPERHGAFLEESGRLLHNALSALHSRVNLLHTFVARYVQESTLELAHINPTRSCRSSRTTSTASVRRRGSSPAVEYVVYDTNIASLALKVEVPAASPAPSHGAVETPAAPPPR